MSSKVLAIIDLTKLTIIYSITQSMQDHSVLDKHAYSVIIVYQII